MRGRRLRGRLHAEGLKQRVGMSLTAENKRRAGQQRGSMCVNICEKDECKQEIWKQIKERH